MAKISRINVKTGTNNVEPADSFTIYVTVRVAASGLSLSNKEWHKQRDYVHSEFTCFV